MNRKILFKAKRKDWEELPKDQWWVEGDLLHTRYDDIVLISNFEDQLFRCDGNTVCQFTGLHDNTKWGDLTDAEKESFLSEWIADYNSAWVPKEEKTYYPEERNVYDGYIDRVGMWKFFGEVGSVYTCDKEFGTDKETVYDVVTAWMPKEQIEPYKEE